MRLCARSGESRRRPCPPRPPHAASATSPASPSHRIVVAEITHHDVRAPPPPRTREEGAPPPALLHTAHPSSYVRRRNAAAWPACRPTVLLPRGRTEQPRHAARAAALSAARCRGERAAGGVGQVDAASPSRSTDDGVGAGGRRGVQRGRARRASPRIGAVTEQLSAIATSDPAAATTTHGAPRWEAFGSSPRSCRTAPCACLRSTYAQSCDGASEAGAAGEVAEARVKVGAEGLERVLELEGGGRGWRGRPCGRMEEEETRSGEREKNLP